LDLRRRCAISTGFARGEEDLEVNLAGIIRSGVANCNDYD
jgi:hypothetical protein